MIIKFLFYFFDLILSFINLKNYLVFIKKILFIKIKKLNNLYNIIGYFLSILITNLINALKKFLIIKLKSFFIKIKKFLKINNLKL